jgi:hypothetical protein
MQGFCIPLAYPSRKENTLFFGTLWHATHSEEESGSNPNLLHFKLQRLPAAFLSGFAAFPCVHQLPVLLVHLARSFFLVGTAVRPPLEYCRNAGVKADWTGELVRSPSRFHVLL